MKNLILLLLTFNFSLFTYAQNLVPNPSFEEYTVCPNFYYMLPNDWYSCSADPDYFNSCDTTYPSDFSVPSNSFGYQEAATGNAYCGFYSLVAYPNNNTWFYKEYLGCKLNEPLIIGQKYFVSFKVNYAGHIALDMETNNIGLLFSTNPYIDAQPYDTIWGIPTINFAHINCTYVIEDTSKWTLINGSIIADSSYNYIVIGNFFDISHTDTVLIHNYSQHKAYYFLDDVCVSKDSLTCNNSVNIKNNEPHDNINFYQTKNAIFFELHEPNYVSYNIYNELGIVINSGNNIYSRTIKINISDLKKGLYFTQIQYDNKKTIRKFIKL